MNKNYSDMSLAELKQLETELIKQKNATDQMQYALKIAMNSIYGAFCNAGFLCFNSDSAEAITTQGRDLCQFGEKILNKYMNDYWIKDKELHKKLGCKNPVEITEPIVIYADTDSNFVCFHNWLKLNFSDIINDVEACKEKILKLFEYRLSDYIKKGFDNYAKKFNTDNIQDFELEAIFLRGILLEKKKYVLDTIWKMPGINIEPLSKLKTTGVEMVRTNTPVFVGEKLTDFVKILLQKGTSMDINDLTARIRNVKKEFMLADILDICYTSNIKEYNNYIIKDKGHIVCKPSVPIHYRAAANYNFVLQKNSQFENKYQPIFDGTKIYYYYSSNFLSEQQNVFAFPFDGQFPIEFAPPIDRELMFEKVFLQPLNRFVSVVTKKTIPKNLIFHKKLF